MKNTKAICAGLGVLGTMASAGEIQPTWESMAADYRGPQWFVDGKIGVWMHWGVPSGIDENRPNHGSHYARRMYSVVSDDYTGKMGMSEILTKWHTKRYGHPSKFGYEKLVPRPEVYRDDGLRAGVARGKGQGPGRGGGCRRVRAGALSLPGAAKRFFNGLLLHGSTTGASVSARACRPA